MGDRTRIEWTDATWNPVTGCTHVSEGCRNCCAERMAATRLAHTEAYAGTARINENGEPRWTGKVNLLHDRLTQPLRWRRPRRIFVNAMSDLFHEEVPDEFIDQVFAVMALSPDHTFQVLTKRPQRMRKYLSSGHLPLWKRWGMTAVDMDVDAGLWIPTFRGVDPLPWPLPNVWLGVSVEDQPTANERIPLLLQTPAAVRWVSAEPLLGPVDLVPWLFVPDPHGAPADLIPRNRTTFDPSLDWVIVGGESGPGARPMHPDWVRSIRDQCVEAGVAFNFKQWGEYLPYEFLEHSPPYYMTPDGRLHDGHDLNMLDPETGDAGVGWMHDYESDCSFRRVGKKAAGRMLDGVVWDEYPGGEG